MKHFNQKAVSVIKILFPKGFQLIVTAITSALFWPAIAEP